jgi:vacuolar iron transporter family protein
MLTEELGLQLDRPQPLRAALTTFVAFLVVGLVPLLSFMLARQTAQDAFLLSAVATGLAFLLVGVVRGIVQQQSILRTGLETLFTGGAAAAIAYLVGFWLNHTFGV